MSEAEGERRRRMDDLSGTYNSAGKPLRNDWAPLSIVRGLIRLLANLFSVTEEDLREAGVYLPHTLE